MTNPKRNLIGFIGVCIASIWCTIYLLNNNEGEPANHRINNLQVEISMNEYLTEFSGLQEKPSAAIIYLGSDNRLEAMLMSLQYLFTNFNDRFRYPVVIFHAGDLNKSVFFQKCLAKLNESKCELIEVVEAQGLREFPPSFNLSTIKDRPPPDAWRFPNYHQMCAFFFFKIYSEPWLISHNISYYMRIDTDSLILSDIQYDIFKYMQRNDLSYAYRIRIGEDVCCSRYLINFLSMYTKEAGIGISSPELEWVNHYSLEEQETRDQRSSTAFHLLQYYSNLEVVNVRSFRDDPAVWKWELAVWNDTRYHVNGIFTQRWGDALLRFYTIHLFPQLWKSIHYLCHLDYEHQGHYPATCNFTEKFLPD